MLIRELSKYTLLQTGLFVKWISQRMSIKEKKIIQTYVEHGQLKYLFVRLKQRVGENAVTFQDIKKAKTKLVHPFSSATIFLRVA